MTNNDRTLSTGGKVPSNDLPAAHSDPAVVTFRIGYRRYLNADGTAAADLPAFAENSDAMIAMYRAMALTRAFDSKAVAMQRIGKLGTYPSSLGQEAVSVGVGAAMAHSDVLLSTYREQGAHLWRGVTLKEILLLWGGDERGGDPSGPREDFPFSIAIASHAPHAVGVAAAMKLRGETRATVCVLGDGATSKGDFYEAINLAGAWHLPVVFLVNNNGWAISVPRSRQSAAETLAQKAIAAGFDGEQVDGNDVIAVRLAMEEALTRARQGGGPALIEALTYRLSDHTTADDASRYRSEDEVGKRWLEEPLTRLRAYMGERGWWNKADEEHLVAACKARVETAVEAYFAEDPEPPSAMFDNLYATLPKGLAGQRDWVK